MSLSEELESFLETLEVALPDHLDEDTPLVSSGLLDSSALFSLMLWIERKVGAAIDPSSVDIGKTWNSQRLIIAFIEARQVGQHHHHTPATLAKRASSKVRVVAYSVEHEDAVVELTRLGLWSPSIEANRRYLEWKHLQNPYGSGPRLYLAFDGSELVGMRSFYPARWQVGLPSHVEDVLVADDLVVRESHRNRGVVTELMQAAIDDLHQQGAEYLFNLSGGRLTVLGSLAMGWRSVGHLNPLGRMSSSHALFSSCRQLLAGLPLVWRSRDSPFWYTSRELQPFARLGEGTRHISKEGVTVEIATEPRVDDMASLIARLDYDGRIRHVRDVPYLSWRYRNPLNEYRFFYAGSDPLHGYLVAKCRRHGFGLVTRVEVVDWESDDERHLEALLEAAISAGAFPELVVWVATRKNHVVNALLRSGFEPVDRHLAALGCPCILVRSCDSSRPPDDWLLHKTPLLDLGRWDMRMIYSMAG